MVVRRVLSLLAFIYMFSTPIFHQQGYCDPSGQGNDHQQKNLQKESVNGEQEESAPRRSIQMQEIQIRGEVEKPKAMFIIPRATSDYFQKGKSKDFSQEILSPIDIQLMEDMARYQESTR